MRAHLALYVFIDACGWEIIKDDPFAREFAPHRQRLTSVFGYSSACVPSIVSGRWPAEHRNWCYFVYDPEHSPFRSLRWLRWLPSGLTGRRMVRRRLSAWVKRRLRFRGYFDLYNMPFEHLWQYDFTEKKSPLQPGGMNCGENIFDYLEREQVAYHVSAPERGEEANLATLLRDLQAERVEFAFLYWPALDALLHREGNQSPNISPKLRLYERWIGQMLETARKHYGEIRLYVFSDHGMANCDEILDLRARIDALPLKFGRDYAVVYDSTMARFWFFNETARRCVTTCLADVPQGRILAEAELQALGTSFPDSYFGELMFLLNEGVLIVPSHMGARPIRAMHGYHPREKHSFAALCTNQAQIPEQVTAIPHLFELMARDGHWAKAGNRNAARAPVA
ncbi:MAG TPA: alkaline phosphatase family protein [Verrucomicrobiae bacterium]|nr:alkaline phosphatase family protein [Verrucomicrobiae bacterium]